MADLLRYVRTTKSNPWLPLWSHLHARSAYGLQRAFYPTQPNTLNTSCLFTLPTVRHETNPNWQASIILLSDQTSDVWSLIYSIDFLHTLQIQSAWLLAIDIMEMDPSRLPILGSFLPAVNIRVVGVRRFEPWGALEGDLLNAFLAFKDILNLVSVVLVAHCISISC